MPIRNLALLGLVAFSGQLSSATRLGPRQPWRRELNQTSLSASDISVTTESHLPASSLSTAPAPDDLDTVAPGPDDPSGPESPQESAPQSQTSTTPPKITAYPPSLPSPPSPFPSSSSPSTTSKDAPTISTGAGDSGGDSPSKSSGTGGDPAPPSSDEGDYCTSLAEGEVKTVYSIIYTETVTWTGDPADYTPPHPTLDIPTYCESDLVSMTGMPPAPTTTTRDDSLWHTACLTQTDGTSTCYTEPYFNPSFIFSSRPKSADATNVPVTPTAPMLGSPEAGLKPTSTFCHLQESQRGIPAL
ncbi:unnamed protein product [Parascedosporium putredinis]|uniref:Uncharacterized protein n=1 Tax=Parascedosporium putredinis TaxID=1442378 RepID=A0A9P1GU95_9PEZI|nr:unnamed protein product [Parascedosporium putredinis]CAI7987754.1 unnamed protein product [Parascedosporium putredinis]